VRLLIGVTDRGSDNGTRRERSAELTTGGNPELREYPVQVCADRAMREVQSLPDFAVRQALCRELSDLQFLRG
jgi:hypothetical protein